ncbi:MAG: UDP-N-acetylmuramoyl-L-alanyl-D-glutamate--2,6-diaminopimelate ligase [Bacteroidales bacterium]|jgi:UDP-N-acetylmuramoyl-L-alanyl-D-glutamate--2,6-diaminopimelate ligase|nr:UDP-N-acetylmuramoyl-L-alanyl-D-glutamate--2,6-diaminopimelate ligase [Bacteroidales bacterium]
MTGISINILLKDLEIKSRTKLTDYMISSLVFDSRKIEKDCLFVAIRGSQADGHQYISGAVEKGAIAIVCEIMPEIINSNTDYILVEDASLTLGKMAAAYYHHPSDKLRLIGVTGTNGKTTIATLLYRLFTQMGFRCGLLSTVENKVAEIKIEATHTTPDAVSINRLLSNMCEAGCEFAFMEVSSHAIDQNRIAGLTFSGGIFTNLTHDHLDYHKTFAAYLHAKKKFFDSLGKDAFALTNTDDRNGMVMLQNTKARKCTYALKTLANYHARILENHFEGLLMTIGGQETWFRLVGEFNASNLLAIYGAAMELGFEQFEILSQMSQLESAEGRFEYVRNANGITGIIDYAHTPDALDNVLSTITGIRQAGERIIAVIGAGGDRDKAKRSEMAKIAVNQSDVLILTSDNPRSEDPETIIQDMKEGLKGTTNTRVLSIVNRREAIRTACMLAQPGDIILVAGKGHEKYQEIQGIKHPFDDKTELTEALGINI